MGRSIITVQITRASTTAQLSTLISRPAQKYFFSKIPATPAIPAPPPQQPRHHPPKKGKKFFHLAPADTPNIKTSPKKEDVYLLSDVEAVHGHRVQGACWLRQKNQCWTCTASEPVGRFFNANTIGITSPLPNSMYVCVIINIGGTWEWCKSRGMQTKCSKSSRSSQTGGEESARA